MSTMRRLFRFRLRTLFVTITVLAVAAAFVARPIQVYRQEREALAKLPGSRLIIEPVVAEDLFGQNPIQPVSPITFLATAAN